ncbi:MAG TPA: hypothetical protein ENI95_09875 [Chloroflexi bacterium]|nr:hypothetical protein [Chloroflexota bacterium]
MTLKSAWRFTLHRLFFGDMLLNWFLGGLLTFFPSPVDRLMGQAPLLTMGIYRLIGVGFLAFAAWQTWCIARQRLGPAGLVFAALMAEGPVVLLTIALVFMDFPLRPVARVALWVGDVYMLFLGAWYLFLARWLAKEGPVQPQETG